MELTIGDGKVRHGSLLDVNGTRYRLQITQSDANTKVIQLQNEQTGDTNVVGQASDGELEFAGILFRAKILDNPKA